MSNPNPTITVVPNTVVGIDVAGQIPTIDTDPGIPGGTPVYSSDQDGDSRYNQDLKDTVFNDSTGILALPVAGPVGTIPKLVRLHAPIRSIGRKWTVERENSKPTLPHWLTGLTGETLTGRSLIVASQVFVDGSVRVLRVSGTYSYAYALAPTDSDTYRPGVAQVDISGADSSVTSGQFDPSSWTR